MWGADINRNGDDLTGGVAKYFASVRKGNTLAVPKAAVRVGALEVLDRTLDVAVVVGVLLVINLFTAGGLEAVTGQTRRGTSDVAVSGDRGDEASEGNGGGVGLHFDCSSALKRASGAGSERDRSLASF